MKANDLVKFIDDEFPAIIEMVGKQIAIGRKNGSFTSGTATETMTISWKDGNITMMMINPVKQDWED